MQKLPNSWLFSESFVKRSMAVLGHYICGLLMIYGVILIIVLAGSILVAIGNLFI